jgi:hypothetical protein
MAQRQLRIQALRVPQSGRHDTKPEGSRLTTNAITGLTPRRTGYDVTDPGERRRSAAGHAARSEVLVFSVLLAE